MGVLDWISGNARPEAAVPVRSPGEVRAAILAAGRPTAPFIVREGRPEEADLIAEWRVVDAQWYGVFAKAGLTKVAQVLMRLDPAAREVRSVDQEWAVQWRGGIPALSLQATRFLGQHRSIEFGLRYGFTEQGELGEVYRYRFSTEEMRDPLRRAALASGWAWRGLAFSKL